MSRLVGQLPVSRAQVLFLRLETGLVKNLLIIEIKIGKVFVGIIMIITVKEKYATLQTHSMVAGKSSSQKQLSGVRDRSV